MAYNGRMRAMPYILLAVVLGVFPPLAPAQDGTAGEEVTVNPAGITLQRDHVDTFTGGDEVLVTVTITAATDLPLFALGLYESAPTGWTFQGLTMETGPQPDILPPLDASGVLEFGWVSPEVPVRFSYGLRTPARDGGARVVSGQVEYRLETDPKQNSAPVLTRLTGEANEAPVLTLRGAATMRWRLNQPYVDPGATATDKEDGDLSDQIQVAGQVDVREVDTYTLTYGVVDSTGLRAETVTRRVSVVEDGTGPTDGAGAGTRGANLGGAALMDSGEADESLAGFEGTSPSDAQDDMMLLIPETSLGGNRPTHILPRADDQKTDGGTSSDGTGPGADSRADRVARAEPSALSVRHALDTGVAPEHDVAALADTEMAGGRTMLIFVLVLVLVFVVPGVVSVARWHGVFRRRRRR